LVDCKDNTKGGKVPNNDAEKTTENGHEYNKKTWTTSGSPSFR
jgi:hypothetical protein